MAIINTGNYFEVINTTITQTAASQDTDISLAPLSNPSIITKITLDCTLPAGALNYILSCVDGGVSKLFYARRIASASYSVSFLETNQKFFKPSTTTAIRINTTANIGSVITAQIQGIKFPSANALFQSNKIRTDFFNVTAAVGGNATIFTNTTGVTILINGIYVVNNSAGTFNLKITDSSLSITYPYGIKFGSVTTTDSAILSFPQPHFLKNGDFLQINTDSTSAENLIGLVSYNLEL